MKELKIGEIVEVGPIRLQCRENLHCGCVDCYWLTDETYCDDAFINCGHCSSVFRTDHKNVIFVKVV